MPEALASAVFSFGASRTVSYDSPDWCTAPPLRNCRQPQEMALKCPYTSSASFSEMDFTHFVAVRHKLPLAVIGVPAFLSKHGIVADRAEQGELPTDWDERRASLGGGPRGYHGQRTIFVAWHILVKKRIR